MLVVQRNTRPRYAASNRVHGARIGFTVSLLAAVLAAGLLIVASPSSPAAEADSQASNLEFFEKRIRPLLVDQCYACHSAQAEKLKGALSLDSRDAILHGGELGPSVVPGDPEKSLLIKAVRYTDPDLQMPPKKGRLTDRQIADLTLWVKQGAPWPSEPASPNPRAAKASPEITETDRGWWAFQPIRRPSLPSPQISPDPTASDRSLESRPHPIDALIDAALQSKGLQPNPRATRRELIRRASFDLLGLPPTPDAVAAFESDPSADAWPRLIDHLLAQPQYGERWARHWLDVVRFAQSNGYERDGEKPLAWRYRDYVVKALNEDKPYNRFVQEQIAGDELDEVTHDGLIATGFQRLGVWDDEPDDKRMAEFDELDDVLSTTGSAFLGLTIGCARCHDHKFDPIPQADYYRLLSFFRNLRLSEGAKYTLDSANYVPLADTESVYQWRSVREARQRLLQEGLAVATDEILKKELSQELAALNAEKPPFEWALAVRERGPVPPPTHVLVRGNAGSPATEVQPGFLSVLQPPASPTSPPPPIGPARRRALAEWISSPSNPLTARVFVNRVWQHHFGRGIVKTSSDFGKAGVAPTHPQLLDWLAAEFIENGWSIKKLHKTILMSAAYQRSSRTENPAALAADPGNDLYWRQNLRRLEAEALRDTFLSLSGQLNPAMGGRGFFPRLSGEVLAGQSRPGLDWEISGPEDVARRSLYVYVRRTMLVPMLDAFDYSNTTSPLAERPITTVAPQSLLLLNDAFMHEQAQALAQRLVRETSSGDTPALIRRGFQLAVARDPSASELALARDFLRRQEAEFTSLQSRITFRPDVPMSLSVDYLGKLQPGQFLIGPSPGWTYHRGKWSSPYEGIRTLERDRGPFALLTGTLFTNAVVRARVLPHTAFESGGLLMRASSREDSLQGYEFTLEPREQRVQIRRHDTQVTSLAESRFSLPPGEGANLRLAIQDDRIQAWIGDEATPILDVRDPHPLTAPGQIGVRAWGAALSLEDLAIEGLAPSPIRIRNESLALPAQRALQAFCLLLLNLNEVVYID